MLLCPVIKPRKRAKAFTIHLTPLPHTLISICIVINHCEVMESILLKKELSIRLAPATIYDAEPLDGFGIF
jgi:hypothetical protein